MAPFIPKIRHFGFMVDDAVEYAKSLSAAFPALTPWKFSTMEVTEDEVVVGPPCKFRTAIASVGDVTFELVEAVDSPNSYHAQAPRGLHHMAYAYEGDFEEEKRRLLSEGFTIEWAAHRHDGEEVYFFRPEAGGYVLEVNNDFDYETMTLRKR